MRETTLHRIAERKVGPLGPFFLKCHEDRLTDAEVARILELPLSTTKKWKARYLKITRTVELREPAAR